jgi:hypothetical protein
MIHYLLLFQFPFIYCVIIVLGLVVYGSDFDEVTGNLYLVALLLLPALHWFVARLLQVLASAAVATLVLIIGALVALLAYKQLHFTFWDEHSLSQAIELSLLGVLSYLASVIASMRLAAWEGNHRLAGGAAWLVLGLWWMLVFYYPMSPLFVLAVILAVSSIWTVTGSVDWESLRYRKFAGARLVKYLLFILMMDLGLVIWDYQVGTGWAWQVSSAMLAAALGCWLAFNAANKHMHLVMIVAITNFIAAILWPLFILHHLHSALIGLSLGWCIGYLIHSQGTPKPLTTVAAALPVFLGLALGYAVYANLAYAYWRIVLLVPLLILWILASRKPTSDSVVATRAG